MFSLVCPGCQGTPTASFCNEEACRRKFVPQPGYSSERCPLHDHALLRATVPDGFRVRKFEDALRCPRCGRNLFGHKPADRLPRIPTG